jgi:hypothetical protein
MMCLTTVVAVPGRMTIVEALILPPALALLLIRGPILPKALIRSLQLLQLQAYANFHVGGVLAIRSAAAALHCHSIPSSRIGHQYDDSSSHPTTTPSMGPPEQMRPPFSSSVLHRQQYSNANADEEFPIYGRCHNSGSQRRSEEHPVVSYTARRPRITFAPFFHRLCK